MATGDDQRIAALEAEIASARGQIEADQNIMKANIRLSQTVREVQAATIKALKETLHTQVGLLKEKEETMKDLEAQLDAALADVARKDAGLKLCIDKLDHRAACNKRSRSLDIALLPCNCDLAVIEAALAPAIKRRSSVC